MIAPAKTRVTVPFGATGNDYLGDIRVHRGVDFSFNPDRGVYMPEDGIVTCIADDGKRPEGSYIRIVVGNRRHALCHLSSFLVSSGQFVTAGTKVAVMGDTGLAFGVHLHWALAIDNVLVNGLNYINKEETMSTVGEVELDYLSRAFFGYPADSAFVKAWKGTETNTFIRWCMSNPARKDWETKIVEWQKAAQAVDVVPVSQLYVKKG